jgi:hypothetical protein
VETRRTASTRRARFSVGLLVAGVLAAAALLVAGSASAAVWATEYCPGDSGDLQNDINSAPYGATIVINGVCFGNYTVSGRTLTLLGGSFGAGLNGRGTGTTLVVEYGADVTVRNLTITNGNSPDGGGVDVYESTLTMTNSTVKGNRSAIGGGIRVEGNSSVSLTGVTVTRNQADYEGGGIAVGESELSMTASTVSLNKVTGSGLEYGGGGIWLGTANALLTSTKVTTNTSSDYGGGIADYGACQAIQTPPAPPVGDLPLICRPTDNAGTASGRSVVDRIALDSIPVGLTLVNSSVDHNIAADDGGGIYNTSFSGDSPVTLQGSTVSFNNAQGGDGGGIVNYGECENTASVLATGSTFQGNLAPNGDGGAVYNATGSEPLCYISGSSTALVTIAQSGVANGPNVVNSNQAVFGGGFANEQHYGPASLTLQPGATVRGNKASRTGGGVWNNCGSFSSLAQIFLNTPNNVVSVCIPVN